MHQISVEGKWLDEIKMGQEQRDTVCLCVLLKKKEHKQKNK